MSWASHNPELYDQMCRRGIAEKLCRTNQHNQFTEDEVESYLENMIDSCEGSNIAYRIYNILCDWAEKDIHEKEVEYFNDLVP